MVAILKLLLACSYGAFVTLLTLIIVYTKDEFSNNFITATYNNALTVTICCISILFSIFMFSRILLHGISLPVPTLQNFFQAIDTELNSQNCSSFKAYLHALVISHSITVITAIVTFSLTCQYKSCYTVSSPLYAIVLIYLHAILLGFLIRGLEITYYYVCCCDYLFNNNNSHEHEQATTTTMCITYETVQKLWTTKETNCTICNTVFGAETVVKMISSCGHFFHEECIRKLDDQCPVCCKIEK